MIFRAIFLFYIEYGILCVLIRIASMMQLWETVQTSRGKQAISVRAIEVLLNVHFTLLPFLSGTHSKRDKNASIGATCFL